MIGIYKITNPNDLIYIGQSIDIKRRWHQHSKKESKELPALYNSIKKHGYENHKFEVIEECDVSILTERETYWIHYFDSVKNGLNCKVVGVRGYLSQASRNRLSKSLIEANKNPETKERRAAWQRGRKMSADFCKGQSERKKGKRGHPNQIKVATGNNNAQKQPVEIYKNGILVSIQENLYKAAEYVNGDYRNVHRAINHATKRTHMGHTFKRQEQCK